MSEKKETKPSTTQIRRIWVVEEVVEDGKLAQRQTMQSYVVDEATGHWAWVRPDDRLSEDAIKEWDRVMKSLKNLAGKDLRSIVCAAGLMDYCLKNPMSGTYDERTSNG
jgi:hypothetical protein